ncbi:MAG: HAD family hydrolase [Bacteroidales bacterium]|nr:HAD family hydrolase [Bacteroidales bacterium]
MMIKQEPTTLIFDWGDTIMRDFDKPGSMSGWDEVAYIPGAQEVLKVLSQKYTCIIATSANHSGTEEMIAALKRVDADIYFHHFFSSAGLGYQKPDPMFFKSISDKLGVEPGKCVMIGNLYTKDITGAKKAGMQTILFDEKKQNVDFPDADVVIHHLLELKKILG